MEKTMTKNKQMVINMSASFIAYIITFGISFFLSPYIVKNVGVDAYGFVGLANNFIGYVSLITIALNSLAGRFITVKIYEKDIDGANIYFSSVFIANVILSVVMGLIATVLIVFLDKIINIPINLATDVRILFIALFANSLMGTAGSVFHVSTFATNKLYLNSLREIEGNLIRVVFVIALFFFFSPKISYIGISSLAVGVYTLSFNIYYTKKLLPYISIRKKWFHLKSILELISSGIWNLITRIGQLLQDGLDLLITNLFISAQSMGILSLAKTIPSIITGIVGTLVGIFAPNFTILYAEKKDKELLDAVKQSMKIMGVIANLPVIVLIVCGKLFFSLWQPTQNAQQLHILSILTCAGLIFNGGINCIYDIFTVVNKLKLNSILICLTGLLNVAVVYILLKTTNLGIYAVAGVSTTIATIRNLVFTAPYGAHCLKQKWYYLYPYILRPVLFVIASCFISIAIKSIFNFEGWMGLFALGIVTALVSVLIGMFIILNKDDRAMVMSKIRRKN